MSAASRLPARPSLEQLRKQAKEKLQQLRESDPSATLAVAQYALALDYGFESWPKLVHHVEAIMLAGRLGLLEQLANDMLAGYGGDATALERVGAYFGDSYNNQQRQERLQDRINALQRLSAEPTLDDVRLVLARHFGFDTWADLAHSISQPVDDVALSGGSTQPLYRIDAERNIIQPQPPLTDRDWDTLFAVMEERAITGINTSAITDSALDRLSRLDFVTRLNLDGARQLSDDGLLLLARMAQLEELDLSGWYSPITDRGLDVLRHLKNLKRISMCWPQRVTDAGVANLSFCDQLESVNLMGTPTGDGAINALRGKRHLREFSTGKLVTDAGIPLLHDLPVFKTWQGGEVAYDLMSFSGKPNNLLLDGPITDNGLRALAGLDGVFGLNLFWHALAFTSAGLAALAELRNLGFLGCNGERCDDIAMRHIAAIPKLRMLMAQGTVATDDGFAALSRSKTIEYIWGRECPNLGSRGFASLAAMPALKGLAVSCLRVDDAALATLQQFPALTSLMPMDVPDEGFCHVGKCTQLEKLWCMYCRDTGDAATAHIAELKLERYYAGKTRITDRSLEILGQMQSLEKLEFWEIAGITDDGIAALARLPHLREISVEGSPNVSRTGMAVFPASVRVSF